MKDKEFKEREKFIDVYADFNKWLHNVGFRTSTTRESMNTDNYHYSFYDNYIDSLCSVESYYHDVLKMKIVFVRDRYEHKFMFVGGLSQCSEVMSLEEFKKSILEQIVSVRDEKLKELTELNF